MNVEEHVELILVNSLGKVGGGIQTIALPYVLKTEVQVYDWLALAVNLGDSLVHLSQGLLCMCIKCKWCTSCRLLIISKIVRREL